jgi:ferrous iron transport protein A
MREKAMVLSGVDPGKEVTLIGIDGGRGIRSRLYSMGLVPGERLRVLNGNNNGPILIVLKGCSLAIGRGMARKMMVV